MSHIARLLFASLLCVASTGRAQDPLPPPPPPPPPASPTPAPAAPAPAAPAPQPQPAQPYAQPAPQPQPIAPAPQPAPQPVAPAPQPRPAVQPQPVAPAPQPPPRQPQPQPAQPYSEPYQQSAAPPSQNRYGPPPPRPAPDDDPAGDAGSDSKFEMPPFSIRVDPLAWLFWGRLGFELEVAVIGPLTVEIVPVFVTDGQPYFGVDSDEIITQESDGIGALAGGSIGLGLWLGGTPFRSYVLRATLTNYSYLFTAADEAGEFDSVKVTERRFVGYLGSQSRFGAFTIESGIAIGYELGEIERCGLEANSASGNIDIVANEPASGCKDKNNIAVSRVAADPSRGPAVSAYNLNSGMHPLYLGFRFSLGVSFD